jgi:phosphate transport system protein
MTRHLQRDLDNLQRDLLAEAAHVEEAIHFSIQSLQAWDKDRARQVIDGDPRIDEEENLIEDAALKILALHQPVAIDLRRVASILKINTSLERMADLAASIAQRVTHLVSLPRIVIPDKLQIMTDLTTSMVREALDAFVNLDTRRARRVIRLDDEVDRLNAEIIEELVPLMKSSADAVEPGLSLFSVTRHLERIADHATNIGEDVVYLVEGEIVRHRPSAIDGD